ncbi:energy-coupling factor transporter transmembrane component T family protein [Faecalicatena contorta]|uniref:Energy-coupling factor transport system permease protein n=1 Tax=Faecalicatena contorta TaxID=39482 RepID=A0A315ZZG3_9FIRM|nr:energy-coupling factor transporter transmembrane component T [Faecalicatena contorta]PWJ50298.1 energy-coupling factor transport system permease protein [Faecalicatena contorta]SUQ13706.1 energy-coupling factor transport system permease protein [Faecalicatena contorta]
MKAKLFDYIDRDNFIYNLSGLTKLVCFICMTFSVMFSYDIRYILLVMALSVVFFRMSEIKFKQIKLMTIYVAIFLLMNFILTYIFSPQYGIEIYGTNHELFRLNARYTVTLEQLLYQVTKITKYASVVPMGMIFLLTTNPSEFAASLNRVGCNYKGAYALSLTLRYFPDMIRDYQDIALAQQSRGLDMSRKEKLGTRVKNVMNICVPLIFSTLDKIELISNAMDLRGFGKHKKRTWYAAKPLKKGDWGAMVFGALILAGSLFVTFFVNGSRFYNPF